MRKPMAPRLLPSFSNPSDCRDSSGASSLRMASTRSRIRATASAAWSRPSTFSTPRICASSPGTGSRTERSAGLRKNWSRRCSASAKVTRSSPTTVPRVCRSLTRRYSSSIQGCRPATGCPSQTACSRAASSRMRAARVVSRGRNSASEASRNSTVVATSMACSGVGSCPLRKTCWATVRRAWVRGWLSGCSRSSDSTTSPS